MAAFDGKYAPSYRRATPAISISGVESASQAADLIRKFDGIGCKSHLLELAVQASQLTLAGIKTSELRLLPFEINRVATTVARANTSSALFSIHFGQEKTDGLSEEQLERVERITAKVEPWRQMFSVVSLPRVPTQFERTSSKYGVQSNLGWDRDVIDSFNSMEARFPYIFTCMEVRDISGTEMLSDAVGLNYLVVNLPQIDGKGFDAGASVAAAELFLKQRSYITVGFVGGLKPETIGPTIGAIAQRAKTAEFSIGLESGIRSDGRFDMQKAASAIEEATAAFRRQEALLRTGA